MRALAEAAEDGRGEGGRPEVDGASLHAGRCASRRARMRLLALVARGAVQDQDAVEVVHLVLDDPRLQALASIVIALALLVLRRDPHVDGPLDVDVDAGQAQAALLGELLVLARTTRSPG